MRKVRVIGVGMTKFGKYYDTPLDELGYTACKKAIEDSGIDKKDIKAAFCGHVLSGPVAGQRVIVKLGLGGIPVTNVENYCASGSTALREAWHWISSGAFEVVLAFGMEKMYGKIKGGLTPDSEDLDGQLGYVMPAGHALSAKRYMADYGATREQIAMVSVKNHKNGCLNPYAQYQKECTVEEVLKSRPICEPINVLDCCPIGDGAAAAIVCSEEYYKKKGLTRGITIAASALVSGAVRTGVPDLNQEDISWRAGKAA